MSVTILTTTYKRPFLLKRLGETIVPLINKLKGKLDWKIIIDDLDDSYDIVLQELKQKVDNKSLVNSIKQKNVGKFKSIINFLNHFKNNNWIVNIDDDDLIINYKFEKFLFKLDSFGDEVNSVLTPSFISNKSIFKDIFNKKNKQFLKYNYQKISYLFFKEKFGDVDSTIFFRRFHINMNLFKDIENDKFTSESLLWLDLFPNNDILIVNNHLVYSEYLPMGLTQETRLNRISNPVSAVAVYRKFLESKKFFFSRFIFKSLINYYRFNLHAKNKIYIANESFSNIFIRFSALNIAKIICLYDKLIIKIKFLYNDYFKTS